MFIQSLFSYFFCALLLSATVTTADDIVTTPDISTFPGDTRSSASTALRTSASIDELISSTTSITLSSPTTKPTLPETPTPSSILTTSVSAEDIHDTVPTVPSPSGSINTANLDILPIQPRVTVAYGFAGAILLLSGVAYTLIGVRVRPLFIFMASAYLIALGVIVLILYVVKPPVSDAVEGAYLIAALVPGLVAGGLSLVFTEVTEGLCCLLGGFALAMWLLALKPGGVVESTGGRAAIITVFSVSAFSLSFSHHTRTHGSIVCIAFGGSTVTILGIDFLSKAGLKEFWVYIWNLNDQLFPIGTTTYPLTRGMKVEIACVIILFCAGIISQMKLWRIVKASRDKREEEQARSDEDREHLEAQRGREIEDSKTREIADWERIYNGKVNAISRASSLHDSTYDSAFESNYSDFRPTSEKDQTSSIRNMSYPSMENIEMESFPVTKSGTRSTIMAVENQGYQRAPAAPATGRRVSQKPRKNPVKGANSRKTSLASLNHTTNAQVKGYEVEEPTVGQEIVQPASAQASTSTPEIIPLPFKTPDSEVHIKEDGSRSEATAGNSSDEELVTNERKFRRQSLANVVDTRNPGLSDSAGRDQEALAKSAPGGEWHAHSRASSVAATVDDLTEDEKSVTPKSRSSSSASNYDTTAAPHGNDDDERRQSSNDVRERLSAKLSQAADEGWQQPLTSDDKSDVDLADRRQIERKQESSLTAKRTSNASSTKRGAKSARSVYSSDQSNLLHKAHVPDNTSHVAIAYRTNEWTKHLDDAEKLELDELGLPPSPKLKDTQTLTEVAAPVQVNELTRTATTSIPLRRAGSLGIEPKTDLSNHSLHDQINTRAQQQTYAPPQDSASHSRPQQVSGPPMQGANRLSAGSRAGNLVRSFSQPLTGARGHGVQRTPIVSQALIESPIEDLETTQTNAPSSNNLVGSSSVYLTGPGYAMSTRATQFDEEDNMSLSSRRIQLTAEDSMTLAQRQLYIRQRMTLYQQQQMQQFPGQQQDLQFAQGVPSQGQMPWPGLSHQGVIYDSHQPKRGAGIDQQKQQALYMQWREELQNDHNPFEAQLQASAGVQTTFLNDRRQLQLQNMQRERERQLRDSVMTTQMRTGLGRDFHREAMKRMQSVANDHS